MVLVVKTILFRVGLNLEVWTDLRGFLWPRYHTVQPIGWLPRAWSTVAVLDHRELRLMLPDVPCPCFSGVIPNLTKKVAHTQVHHTHVGRNGSKVDVHFGRYVVEMHTHSSTTVELKNKIVVIVVEKSTGTHPGGKIRWILLVQFSQTSMYKWSKEMLAQREVAGLAVPKHSLVSAREWIELKISFHGLLQNPPPTNSAGILGIFRAPMLHFIHQRLDRGGLGPKLGIQYSEGIGSVCLMYMTNHKWTPNDQYIDPKLVVDKWRE